MQKRIIDPHLDGHFKFLGRATRPSRSGSVSRYFLKEARIRYRQYQRSGYERMRYWSWSAIQIALQALEKEGATPTSGFAPGTAALSTQEKNPGRRELAAASPRAIATGASTRTDQS